MLENLIGKGLESEPAEAEEIQRLLKKIDTRLTDANHAGISLESRFDLAYEALLQLAVTALRANHLRVTSRGGHHALAMQTLDSSIGYPKEKLRLLDRFRQMRSTGLYDGTFEPSGSEVEALIAEATQLRDHLEQWLAKERPEWMEAPIEPDDG